MKTTKASRGISVFLVLVMLMSMLGTLPAMAAGISNSSLAAAYTALNPESTDVILDFSNNKTIVGDVDVSELLVVHSAMEVLVLDGTNIKSVTNMAGVSVSYNNTFASDGTEPKTLSSPTTTYIYRSGDGELSVAALLATVTVTNSTETVTTLLGEILEDSGTLVIKSGSTQVYPDSGTAAVTQSGSVNMSTVPVGTGYTVELTFGYKCSSDSVTFSFPLEVRRSAWVLESTDPAAITDETLYPNESVELKLTKTDDDGNETVITDMVTFKYIGSQYTTNGEINELEDPHVTLSAVKAADGKSYTITVTDETDTDNKAQTGLVAAFVGDSIIAYYLVTSGANKAVTNLELVEYNGSVTDSKISSNDTSVKEVYVAGGTAISSLTIGNVTGGVYENTTYWLLKDGDTGSEYLDEKYQYQASAVIHSDYESLSAEIVLVTVPGIDGQVLALVVSSGYTDNKTCLPTAADSNGYDAAITVELTDGSTATTSHTPSVVKTKLNVQSTSAVKPVGYEIYAIDKSGPYAAATKAELEAAIASGGLSPSVRYERNSEGALAPTSLNNTIEIIEGDSVYLVATACYVADTTDEKAPRYVLADASIVRWYDAGSAATAEFNATGTTIPDTNIEGVLSGSVSGTPASGYSNVLKLTAGSGAADKEATVTVTFTAANANVTVNIKGVASVVDHYIFVPGSYTLPSSSTYTAELETDDALKALNTDGATVAIGGTESFKAVAVYNNKTIKEVLVDDWTNGTTVTSGNTSLVTVTAADGTAAVTINGTENGGVEDAKAGQSATLTVSSGTAAGTLKVTLGPSNITGVYAVLVDYYGNAYSATGLAGLYAGSSDELKITNRAITEDATAFEIPLGTNATAYAVYKFSNTEFYGESGTTASAVNWKTYSASGTTLTASVSPADIVTVTERNLFGYQQSASATTLTLGVNNATTEITVGGSTHAVQSATADTAEVLVTRAMLLSVQAKKTGETSLLEHGRTVEGYLGNTIDFDLDVTYSDIGTYNSSTSAAKTSATTNTVNKGAPDSALKLALTTGSTQTETDAATKAAVTSDGYGVLLTDQTTGDGVELVAEYTREINGVSKANTLICTGHTTQKTVYDLHVKVQNPTAEKIVLVATKGTGELEDLSGGNYALSYVYGATYKIYPVVVDSSYTLSKDSSGAALDINYIPTYDEVAAGTYSCYRFLSTEDFTSLGGAWTLTNPSSGTIASGASTTEGTNVVYVVTAIGSNNTNSVTVSFDASKLVHEPTSGNYASCTLSGTASVQVYHRIDKSNAFVVDIVAVVATAAGSTTVGMGGSVTFDVDYAVSEKASTTASGETDIVPVSYFGDNLLPGQTGYSERAKNALVVTLLDGPTDASYTAGSDSSGNLVISASVPGTYKFGLHTINNDGVRAPYAGTTGETWNGLRYQVITITVEASQSTGGSVYWMKPTAVDATSTGISGFASLGVDLSKTTEKSTSLLDADALKNGMLSVKANSGTTETAVIELKNKDGIVLYDVTLTLVGATAKSAALSESHTGVGKIKTMAAGETMPLYWNVTYTYADSSGTIPIKENITDWTKVQANLKGVLTLSGDTITASGSGYAVYKATYSALSTEEQFWATVTSADPVTVTYSLLDGSDTVTSLTMQAGDTKSLTLSDGTSASTVSAAESSVPGVASVATSGSTVTVTAVKPGTATITVYGASGKTTLNVTVTDGSSTPAATYTVTGTITDASGAAISGAAVKLTDGTTTYTGTSAADGTVSITDVPAGTYTFTIGAAGYTDNTGTVDVSADTTIGTIQLADASATLYTVWRAGEGGVGFVGVSKLRCAAGETVVVTVTPGGGYAVDTVAVIGRTSGTAVAVTGTYSFTMPAEDVTVKVTWKATGGSSGGGGTGGGGTSGGGSTTETTYTVTVARTTGGSVSADKTSAKSGDTVTLTVKPSSGYELNTLRVVDENENSVTTAATASGTGYTFTMPAANVTVTATFKSSVTPSEKYTDLDKNKWYAPYTDYVIDNGYMNGTGDYTFDPNGVVTRAQIVQVLYNMEGKPAVTVGDDYDDVQSGDWFAKAVAWATKVGVVNGYGNGKFGPNDKVTREQLAAILYRYESYKGGDTTARGDLGKFTDAGTISAYATESVAWAVGRNIINGRTTTTIAPKEGATRVEVAAMISRYCGEE